MDMSETAFTTARRQQTHAGSGQIHLIVFALDCDSRNRARWHAHNQILAIAAMLARAATIAATASFKLALIAKWQQRIEMLIGENIDMPTTAAIAAIGTTARHVCFAPKARRTITTITGLNRYLRTIEKFTSHNQTMPYTKKSQLKSARAPAGTYPDIQATANYCGFRRGRKKLRSKVR
jgi:hypothetical protein